MTDKYTEVEARLDNLLSENKPDKEDLKNVLNDMMRIYTGNPHYDINKEALKQGAFFFILQ